MLMQDVAQGTRASGNVLSLAEDGAEIMEWGKTAGATGGEWRRGRQKPSCPFTAWNNYVRRKHDQLWMQALSTSMSTLLFHFPLRFPERKDALTTR